MMEINYTVLFQKFGQCASSEASDEFAQEYPQSGKKDPDSIKENRFKMSAISESFV
jgi:hypothetical protein